MTVVVCAELAPVIGDLSGNVERSCTAITDAVTEGADVVVLPELVTSGYCFASRQEADSLAIRRDDPVFARWAALAEGAVVVAGFAELEGDTLYNSGVVLDSSGVLAFYRKVHLWDSEKLFFTPGHEPPPVIATRHGAIATMICYDLEFPEMHRSVALRGAHLLAVPTNWPWTPHPPGMPVAEVVQAMAAAHANRMAIACCDRSGTERGTRWNEASCAIDADGWVIATADAAHVVRAEIDLRASDDKQISPRNDVHADRRPEVYR